jgi:hypothetical protein
MLEINETCRKFDYILFHIYNIPVELRQIIINYTLFDYNDPRTFSLSELKQKRTILDFTLKYKQICDLSKDTIQILFKQDISHILEIEKCKFYSGKYAKFPIIKWNNEENYDEDDFNVDVGVWLLPESNPAILSSYFEYCKIDYTLTVKIVMFNLDFIIELLDDIEKVFENIPFKIGYYDIDKL